ncbi:MAG TPA: hypothetical protein PLQ97_13025 [Myxococcota bacterium]|nr:hypothetical protein [Myxococcota bacterium]HQK52112.1 hypothetical protein [Myxococcota bacterium]
MSIRNSWSMVLVLALVACGSSKSLKDFTPSAQEKESAKAVVTSTLKLQEVKTNAASDNPISGLTEIQSSAMQLISAQQSRNAGGGGLGLGLQAAVSSALQQDCVTQSGNRTTYDCTSQSQTVKGYIETSGDTLTVDLTISQSGGYELIYSGSVTVTATLVNGTLSFDYKASSVTYAVDVTYNNVTLQDNCPVAGTLTVDSSYDVAGLPSGYGTGNLDATVEITFGPACGDMVAKGG